MKREKESRKGKKKSEKVVGKKGTGKEGAASMGGLWWKCSSIPLFEDRFSYSYVYNGKGVGRGSYFPSQRSILISPHHSHYGRTYNSVIRHSRLNCLA